MTKPTLGILGAGKLGIALARLGLKAGYEVYITGSKGPEKIRMIMEMLAPGVIPTTQQELMAKSDVIFLALPLSRFKELDKEALKGKILLDAMNYWWETDGKENTISSIKESSSEVVANYFNESFVAKAFNHMGYHDLEIEVDRKENGKKVIAFATNEENIVSTIEEIITNFGFEALFLGNLEKGLLLEPGSPLFGANLTKEEFEMILNQIYETDFGKKIIAVRGKI